MRVLARIGCTLAGMALAAPVAAWADPPTTTPPPESAPAPAEYVAGTVSPGAAATPAPTATPAVAPAAQAPSKPHKHRWSLFGGERVCAECQRARAKARDGVDVPPPPPFPGPVVSGGACAACGTDTTVMMMHKPMAAQESPQAPPEMAVAATVPGHAAVGGEAPGYAAVGNEPAPIGMVQPRIAAAAVPGSARSLDSAVAASSYSPTPPQPVGVNRPHILSHLFGISDIGRLRRESAERRSEEAHASITYGTENPIVTELPAKAVYGK